MADLLQLRDLRVGITLPGCAIEAVKRVSFRVRPASTVALVGESGSGKSITAQAIMGILPRCARREAGEILFADPAAPGGAIDLAGLEPAGARMQRLRGSKISMIFQEPMTSLSPLHTIGDQIGEVLRYHEDCSGAECERRTREMLHQVGFPDPDRAYDTYSFELSGGLRQRAMIAMALICRPQLLIADEPTTALDVTIQAQILKLIADLQRQYGMAVLIITHDLGVVANMADEVVVLYRGEVMESGTRDDVFRHAAHPYLKALFDAAPRIGRNRSERLRPVHRRDGGTIAPTAQAHPAAETILDVIDLRKSYFQRRSGLTPWRAREQIGVVNGVSLSIRRGESLALVGESGSGKTTIAKLIMRGVRPDSGRILFRDPSGETADVGTLSGAALSAYRRRVQYIFQDPFGALDPRMTAFDIITEPLVIHGIGTAADRSAAARDLMRLVDLDERCLNRYPHSFSGGQRQRLCIARALALKPDLLICDEPVSALDAGVQAQVLNLLRDLQTTLGLTYLFVSHNLAVVDYIADRIAVICHGRLVELAPRDMLFRGPVHPYTRGLLAAVPDADPDHALDLQALMDDRAGDPTAWPPPFRDVVCGNDGDGGDDEGLQLRPVADGHFVRATAAVATL